MTKPGARASEWASMVRIKSYGVVAAASLALIVSIVAMVGGQLRLASEREAAHVHAELISNTPA